MVVEAARRLASELPEQPLADDVVLRAFDGGFRFGQLTALHEHATPSSARARARWQSGLYDTSVLREQSLRAPRLS